MPSRQEPVFTQSHEKGGAVTHRPYFDQGEKIVSQPALPVGQKTLQLKKADTQYVHISVTLGKILRSN